MVRPDSFVIFIYVLPYVIADGYPKEMPDTPFNTGVAGGSQNKHLQDSGNSVGSAGYPPVSMDYDSRYRGPVAMLTLLPDGHIAETAEVTAARTAHLAALEKAKALWAQKGAEGGSSQGGAAGGNGGYSYPQPSSNELGGVSGGDQGGSSSGEAAGGDSGYSYPQPGPNTLGGGSGSAQSYLPPQGNSGGSEGQGHGGSAATAGTSSYDGPLAMLMVLPSGYLADTPEIAALRAAHISALVKAQAAWKPQDGTQH